MGIDSQKVGVYIQELRKSKSLTQTQIGERLNVSYQAVSKWERGETLPDTALLVDLAKILETTVDRILNGGETVMDFRKRISVRDVEECFTDLFKREALVAEIVVQNLQQGAYVDISEVKSCFQYEHWITTLLGYADRHGIK